MVYNVVMLISGISILTWLSPIPTVGGNRFAMEVLCQKLV